MTSIVYNQFSSHPYSVFFEDECLGNFKTKKQAVAFLTAFLERKNNE